MKNICQSCSMPLQKEADFGTNKDGSKNEEYCSYCFQDGAFVSKDMTMQEMEDLCTTFMVEDGMDEQEARNLMHETLPLLKRWC